MSVFNFLSLFVIFNLFYSNYKNSEIIEVHHNAFIISLNENVD